MDEIEGAVENLYSELILPLSLIRSQGAQLKTLSNRNAVPLLDSRRMVRPSTRA
jgi:hypothetical protein